MQTFPRSGLEPSRPAADATRTFQKFTAEHKQASCTEQQAAHVLGRQVRYSIVSICFLRRESTMKSNSSYSFQIGAA